MEEFFGDWLVQVTQKNAAFNQRFRIAGSDNADGVYYGIISSAVQVSGARWSITMEWNDNAGSGWQLSEVRTLVSYSVTEGLTKVLGADDNVINFRDNDFDDLVITCKNVNPELNPLVPKGRPMDFTFPENILNRGEEQPHTKC